MLRLPSLDAFVQTQPATLLITFRGLYSLALFHHIFIFYVPDNLFAGTPPGNTARCHCQHVKRLDQNGHPYRATVVLSVICD